VDPACLCVACRPLLYTATTSCASACACSRRCGAVPTPRPAPASWASPRCVWDPWAPILSWARAGSWGTGQRGSWSQQASRGASACAHRCASPWQCAPTGGRLVGGWWAAGGQLVGSWWAAGGLHLSTHVHGHDGNDVKLAPLVCVGDGGRQQPAHWLHACLQGCPFLHTQSHAAPTCCPAHLQARMVAGCREQYLCVQRVDLACGGNSTSVSLCAEGQKGAALGWELSALSAQPGAWPPSAKRPSPRPRPKQRPPPRRGPRPVRQPLAPRPKKPRPTGLGGGDGNAEPKYIPPKALPSEWFGMWEGACAG